jgi:hypothetical protein
MRNTFTQSGVMGKLRLRFMLTGINITIYGLSRFNCVRDRSEEITRKLPEPIVRMLPYNDQSGIQSIHSAVIQL